MIRNPLNWTVDPSWRVVIALYVLSLPMIVWLWSN